MNCLCLCSYIGEFNLLSYFELFINLKCVASCAINVLEGSEMYIEVRSKPPIWK